jgi:hypothetical protein
MMRRRRQVLVAGFLLPVLGCASYLPTYPQIFETTWTEETQLHDGRMIVVRVTRTYQRFDRSSKYEKAVRRTTAVSFDAGPSVGQFSLSVRGNIAMIDQKDSVWYLLISFSDSSYSSSPPVAMDNLRLVRLEGSNVVGTRHSRELPSEFRDLNLMHLTNVEILDQYSGKHITLKDKEEFRKKNNTGISNIKIFPTACAKDGTC